MNGHHHPQRMEQLPWDGAFSDGALAVFDDRSLPRDLSLSGLFPEHSDSNGFNMESISAIDFSAHYAPFAQHHFASSEARSTYPTPPPNMASSPGLMPPPPLPFKVQHHRQPRTHHEKQRRRSSGLESWDSNPEQPSPSSMPATSPSYHQPSIVGSPGSQHTRQYPSPRSPDGQPTHQSPEEFQFAVQRQDSSTTEASDSLFKDWMHVNYEPSPLPITDYDDDENSDEDEDDEEYGRSDGSPAGSDDSVETVKAYRNRVYARSEFLRWGSDSNFSDVKKHYTPEPIKETVESMQEFQLMTLKCLQVSQNEDIQSKYDDEITEPPILRTNPGTSHRSLLKTQTSTIKPEGDQNEDTIKAIRYKRRKMQGNPAQQVLEPRTASDDGQMIETQPKAPSKPRRKRRRNREAKNWPTRPVLTDEQRRQNHIQSEKKRRILINEGFDDLCSLVPTLGKGKFCKSTVLHLAGQWLEELLEGNKVLEKQLVEVKAGVA